MSAESLPREYHLVTRPRTIALGATGVGLFLVAVTLWATGDTPPALQVVVPVLSAALFAWQVVALRRSGTYVDLDGIRVRGLLVTRRLRWAELNEIRAEPNAEASPLFGAPADLAYAYARDGRRIQLLYFDGNQPVFRQEVELVRHAWEELRGPQWTPSPEADAAQVRRRRLRLVLNAVGPAVVLLTLAFFLFVG
ncbi:PH domain-containing protein [Streptomyces marincola]|uniref:PH domain-containing protein n=1 Tax=Streptomyces marincola TaxID=2878388 RepID=UPI001CF3B7CA|nr:PH domain-containing protein [Streptomyces marincola]UCM86628.1 hypothetical protein LC193_00970 [Streptomyces marincola]